MKHPTKRAVALILALLLSMSLLLTGCGGSNGGGSAASDEEAAAAPTSKLDQIIEAGKIVIGVNPPAEPICFYDDAGNLIGYDVDWAKKLGETLGVEVEFVEVNGETRITAVSSGRVDAIFANTTGNLERAKTINFSIPYLRTGIKVMTAVDSPYKNLYDLNTPDATIIVGTGTTMEALVLENAPNANIQYLNGWPEMILSLRQGQCDAILEDGTACDYAAGQYSDEIVSLPDVYTSDPICIGYAKGDPDFARYLDMFVSQMISNGFQAETYEKWFGSEYTGNLVAVW